MLLSLPLSVDCRVRRVALGGLAGEDRDQDHRQSEDEAQDRRDRRVEAEDDRVDEVEGVDVEGGDGPGEDLQRVEGELEPVLADLPPLDRFLRRSAFFFQGAVVFAVLREVAALVAGTRGEVSRHLVTG